MGSRRFNLNGLDKATIGFEYTSIYILSKAIFNYLIEKSYLDVKLWPREVTEY